MHPNPVYRQTPQDQNLAFARERGFGVLTVNGPDGPLVSHIPFVLTGDGSRAEAHLVRSNPIVRMLDSPLRAVIAVSGPDGYISPDWYGLEDQVPTWNYVAVHLRGSLIRMDDSELHPVLDRLSAGFEARLAPKTPWTSAKMDQEAYARMLRQIVPVALDIATVDGTWKLSQNKPDSARLGAADGVEAAASGVGFSALAALMRQPG